MFILEADAQLKYRSSFLLEGNVIDVAVLEDQGTIIYSMDVLYDAFSATVVAGDQEQRSRPTVDAIRYCPQLETWEKGDDTILVSAMRDFLTSQSLDEKNGFTKGKSLRELIYSLGSLRKRSIED